MGQPFVGEIRMFAGSFAPAGWAMCNGAPMPISQNETLFTIIGTTYGGDGQETFDLPNLCGRAPVHQGTGTGQNYQMGESAGVESVTLTVQQIPQHSHPLFASTANALDNAPTNNIPAAGISTKMYTEDVANQAMAANSISPIGGSQPHENMQPYLVITFIISLFGLFPSPN